MLSLPLVHSWYKYAIQPTPERGAIEKMMVQGPVGLGRSGLWKRGVVVGRSGAVKELATTARAIDESRTRRGQEGANGDRRRKGRMHSKERATDIP